MNRNKFQVGRCEVIADSGISAAEAREYLKRGRDKYGMISKLDISIAEDDTNDVILDYETEHIPFERIRRITGYLVGTLDRFNNGKRAEESDRVKHGIEP